MANPLTNTVPQPLFSIFIPSWNNLSFLKLCVESIERNSTYRHEILIHVNDGSDGTLEWVKSKGYRYTHSEGNIGVCWAMNGLRPLMTTDYVAYVNDDMYVLPGWDEALYSEIRQRDDKLWYFGSTLIEPKARMRHFVNRDFGLTTETFREQELLDTYKSLQPGDWSGALFPPTVVHRDIWDLVGGYSVEFTPGMGSDPDFNAKLWLAGIRTFKGIGRSMVYHFKNVSVNRIVKNDGPVQFLRKWGITIRAFYQQILLFDHPWNPEERVNPKTLKTELLRSSGKKLLKLFARPAAKQLWDEIGDDVSVMLPERSDEGDNTHRESRD